MFPNVCEVLYVEWCAEQSSKSSQWLGKWCGQLPSDLFHPWYTNCIFKTGKKGPKPAKNPHPYSYIFKALMFSWKCLKKTDSSNYSPCLIVGLLFTWWVKEGVRLASKELKWHLKVHHTGSQSLPPRSLRQAAGDWVNGWVLFEYLGLSVNALGKGQEQ